ncbi:ribose-5-phosphate isomerase RpiA [Pinibacter aurantiacus]|uniref:Ribose-5-phosphate isomerase A n=1 Tax=Pinibacter aurantiacus TaxID=2851599 RepID=A0A9E2SCL4_9BACT|nr:ribose-5-phosphate isomerase RpiA [Pinibacter aurantiacus]MBV4358649.1 ribose-5-phosphate isomerase RpiA [Pinibacter aurantiacus]
MDQKELEKELAAKEAVKAVKQNQIVGLGTGSTAKYVIIELGKMVKDGLKIQCIPTSNKTAELATSYNIPLVDINMVDHIDVTIDGADEFTKEKMLIKGGGGALLREKIVASLSREEIIIADASKKVDKLGKFTLPIEVIPFALNYVQLQLTALQGKGKLRQLDGKPFLTDQQNYIVDADFGLIDNPPALAEKLNQIEGLVAHGLFIGLATRVIMGIGDSVQVFN